MLMLNERGKARLVAAVALAGALPFGAEAAATYYQTYYSTAHLTDYNTITQTDQLHITLAQETRTESVSQYYTVTPDDVTVTNPQTLMVTVTPDAVTYAEQVTATNTGYLTLDAETVYETMTQVVTQPGNLYTVTEEPETQTVYPSTCTVVHDDVTSLVTDYMMTTQEITLTITPTPGAQVCGSGPIASVGEMGESNTDDAGLCDMPNVWNSPVFLGMCGLSAVLALVVSPILFYYGQKYKKAAGKTQFNGNAKMMDAYSTVPNTMNWTDSAALSTTAMVPQTWMDTYNQSMYTAQDPTQDPSMYTMQESQYADPSMYAQGGMGNQYGAGDWNEKR